MPPTPWRATACGSRTPTPPAGKALGRAGTATFGTSDLAGIDVLAHAVRTHYDGAPQDEQREVMQLPPWILAMVERGTVGMKAGAGFYKDKRTLVIDPETLEYRPREEPAYASLAAAKKTADPGARVAALVASDDPAGRFAWDVTATTLIYAAYRSARSPTPCPRSTTRYAGAMAWELGPFELWDALGLVASVERMTAEGREVPSWVRDLAASPTPSFYLREGSTTLVWDVQAGRHVALAMRPWAISLAEAKRTGRTIRENDDASLVDLGDGIGLPRVPHQGERGQRGGPRLPRGDAGARRVRLRRFGDRQSGHDVLGRSRPRHHARAGQAAGLGGHRRARSAAPRAR